MNSESIEIAHQLEQWTLVYRRRVFVVSVHNRQLGRAHPYVVFTVWEQTPKTQRPAAQYDLHDSTPPQQVVWRYLADTQDKQPPARRKAKTGGKKTAPNSRKRQRRGPR